MKKITLITFLLTVLFSANSFAQANANCSGAIFLTPGETATSSSNSGSQSGVFPSCGPAVTDHWYTFIAPASGEVTLSSTEFYAVYTDCTGTNEVFCGNGSNLVSSLTNGVTYYLQVNPIPIACKGLACGDFSITITGNVLSNKTVTKNQFKVYPNPVKDVLNINAQQNITSIQVYNILGKELLNIAPNNLKATIDLSDFNSGHYIVKLKSNSGSKVVKVFKK